MTIFCSRAKQNSNK